MKLAPHFRWAIASAVWVAVIFFSSTNIAGNWSEGIFHFVTELYARSPQPDSGSYQILHFVAQKGVHVCLFLVFAVLLWHALPSKRRKAAFVLSAALVIGSVSELLQCWFPGRHPALRDICINVSAAGLGIFLNMACARRGPVPQSLLPG